MSEKLLLTALVLLDRTTDDDCDTLERTTLESEIEKHLRFLRPGDLGYFHAVRDIVNFARTY